MLLTHQADEVPNRYILAQTLPPDTTGGITVIVRSARPDRNFTIIQNDLVNDKTIKSDALGLIVYVLSKPDHWKIRTTELQSRFGCGERKVRRALTELRESGYVEMMRHNSGEVDWIFHEISLHTAQNNHTAKTNMSHMCKTPNGQNPHVDNEHVLVSTEKAVRTDKALVNTDSGFDTWWSVYPKKKGKQNALKAWNKIKPDADMLIAHTTNMATNDDEWVRGFAPHPTTYLNQARWNDEVQQRELTQDEQHGLRKQRTAAILQELNGGDVGYDVPALSSPMDEIEW